ncbi:MAG: glycoside hydrolase family 11 protein [Oscillospiraceae bacterium]|nr:glycoside hydrolase family 11 protein [Oscillospiraceae bacterium]
MNKRLFGLLSAAVVGLTAIASTSTSIFASAANVGDKIEVGKKQLQPKGICDGYRYEIWIDQNSGGTGSITLGEGGTYKAEWDASVPQGNFFVSRGIDFGANRRATDYNGLALEYTANYRQTKEMNGNSRLGVYGWLQNIGLEDEDIPLVEYYIIEDWKDWVPDGEGKMVTIDGAEYKIFRIDRTGPSINGNMTNFKQYFSVRQSKRTSGRVSVGEHFKAWAKEGWGIGKLYEVSLNVEGWQSSGNVDVTKLNIYTQLGGEHDIVMTTAPFITESQVNYVKPEGSGKGTIEDDFEGKGTAWQKRGESTDYGLTEDWAYGKSKQSLYVTGRTKTSDGFVIDADEIDTSPLFGHEFSAMVGYKNPDISSVTFTLGMQYELGGETAYQELTKVAAKSGEWKALEPKDFEVPEYARNIQLYVETAYSENPTDADLVSFYLDDVRFGQWVRCTIISTEYIPIDETDTATGIETTMFVTTDERTSTDECYLHTETEYGRIGATTGTETTGIKDVTGTEIGTNDCHPPELSATSKTTAETETTEKEDLTATTKGTDECHPEYNISGDANQDGKVSVSDAILLARVVAEDTTVTITDMGRRMAELDGKTGLSADDLTILLKMLVGIS